MPTLTRWFLRAAMLHLVAAFALALFLALPANAAHVGPWRPVYIHLLVLGWATQMIFGVAYWMFPRKAPLDLKVVPWAGWSCFALLNAGLVLRALSEPVIAVESSPLAAHVVAVAAVLQLGAVVVFVLMMWTRVTAR